MISCFLSTATASTPPSRAIFCRRGMDMAWSSARFKVSPGGN